MTVDPQRALVLGVDFGTLSGRTVVVRVRDGADLGSAVSEYAHGVVDRKHAAAHDELFAEYTLLHDYFGRGGNDVMHRLAALQRRAYTARATGAALGASTGAAPAGRQVSA